MGFELFPRPLLSVQKYENIPHAETGVCFQESTRFDNPATAGYEVVNSQDGLSAFVATLHP